MGLNFDLLSILPIKHRKEERDHRSYNPENCYRGEVVLGGLDHLSGSLIKSLHHGLVTVDEPSADNIMNTAIVGSAPLAKPRIPRLKLATAETRSPVAMKRLMLQWSDGRRCYGP